MFKKKGGKQVSEKKKKKKKKIPNTKGLGMEGRNPVPMQP